MTSAVPALAQVEPAHGVGLRAEYVRIEPAILGHDHSNLLLIDEFRTRYQCHAQCAAGSLGPAHGERIAPESRRHREPGQTLDVHEQVGATKRACMFDAA